MTDRELMQQALDALEQIAAYRPLTFAECSDAEAVMGVAERAIPALRERLAQPNEFQPDWDAMAVMVGEQQRMAKRIDELEAQRREWIGLTDEEIVAIELNPRQYYDGKSLRFDLSLADFARAIEAKLKEKNT